jgi:hypothetical protein
MTAYGTCHKCGAATGVDIYDGKPIPALETGATERFVHLGTYRADARVWECWDCDWTPRAAQKCNQPGPRIAGETRQQWRKRMRSSDG